MTKYNHCVVFSDTRSQVAFSENGRTYIGLNASKKLVRGYDVDGGIITTHERCDKLLIVPSDSVWYFVELKGTDRAKAASQLTATIVALASEFSMSSIVHARAVFSRIAHPKIIPKKEIELATLLKRYAGIYKRGTVRFEEPI